MYNVSNQSAQPHAIHDVIRRTLYHLSTQAMVINAVQEPVKMLRVEGAANQLRPDLGITIPANNMRFVTYAVDISLVCPFKGSKTGEIAVDHHSTKPELSHKKRALDKKAQKDSKYKAVCRAKDCVFVPFIINTTGQIHKQGLTLLRKMANHASEIRDIPAEVLFKYYIKVLNFSLFKQVTRLVYLKAVGTMDARTARQTSKGTFRCVNSLVHSLSEKPHVSVHSIFPDI